MNLAYASLGTRLGVRVLKQGFTLDNGAAHGLTPSGGVDGGDEYGPGSSHEGTLFAKVGGA